MAIIHLTDIAEKEIDEAELWYESQLPGLGEAFYDEVDEKIRQIADSPLQYPVLRRDIRRAVVKRFPFSILFRVKDDAIFVVGCFHAKRNPTRWRRR